MEAYPCFLKSIERMLHVSVVLPSLDPFAVLLFVLSVIIWAGEVSGLIDLLLLIFYVLG